MVFLKKLNFYYTVHEFSSSHIDGFFRWKFILEKYLLFKIKKIIFVSFSLADDVKKDLPKKLHSKCFTVHNFIEKFEYKNISNEIKATIEICSIGRLIEDKGFQYNLEAIHLLISQGYVIHYDIFGSGPYEATLARFVEKYQLEKVVTFKGNVSNDVLRASLNNYKILLIHSKREAFGLTALEAFNAKVPVVASNVPGLNEIVKNKETGLLVPYGDVHQIAEAIKLLVSNGDMRTKIVENSYNFFLKICDENRLKDFYIRFYSSERI